MPSTRETLAGTVRVFLAESLLIPTGLLTAAYLARTLGPDGYGHFTVAAAVVAWIEWSLTALFSRASVKLVADARDWQPIGSTIVGVHLVASVAAALLLWLAAPAVAGVLGAPVLAGYLRLFAADIPLFCLAQAHRSILVGLGSFGRRALAAAARWISRLVLVVLLVELGMSIEGAILGSIGASAIELAVARYHVRPAWSVQAVRRAGSLWGYAGPIVVSALALRVFDKLDLVTLSALGGSPEQAGQYGAAQNLAILPGLFALSFSPLVLSAMSRALRDGETELARRMGRDALRGVLLLAPVAGVVAGAAPAIVGLIFGERFAPSAPILAWLIFGAVGLVLISVTTGMLIAANRPRLALALTGPLPIVAMGGYLLVVPQWGPTGAAAVTAATSLAVAAVLVAAVHRASHALPPAATALRSGLMTAGAYAAAALWPVSGGWVVLQLPLLVLATLLGFGALGEFSRAELTAARALLRRRAPAA